MASQLAASRLLGSARVARSCGNSSRLWQRNTLAFQNQLAAQRLAARQLAVAAGGRVDLDWFWQLTAVLSSPFAL
jgi:hypothetical protein